MAQAELVEGIEELKVAFEEIGDRVTKKVAVEANSAAATELQVLLKAAAPYDPSYRVKTWLRKDLTSQSGYYGHLRDAIDVRRVKARKPGYVVHRVDTGSAFWGVFQEYGFTAVNGQHVGAQPWFRPTLDANKQRLQGVQIEHLRAGVEREAAAVGTKRRRRGR